MEIIYNIFIKQSRLLRRIISIKERLCFETPNCFDCVIFITLILTSLGIVDWLISLFSTLIASLRMYPCVFPPQADVIGNY